MLRGDEAGLTIHETIVQNLPIELFTTLEANDILFIDSSHVLKLGSDVSLLFLEVLPRLRPGVVVHIHDIATSFEYPLEWYEEGRAWNEAPALRAFLAFNQAYEILYFCDYMNRFQTEAVARRDAAGAAVAQGRAGGQHVGQLLDASALAGARRNPCSVALRRRVHGDESASLCPARLHRLGRWPLAALAGLLLGAVRADAATAFGLTTTNQIVTFDTNTPGDADRRRGHHRPAAGRERAGDRPPAGDRPALPARQQQPGLRARTR